MTSALAIKRIATRFGASDFVRHVAMLASGQGVAMAVPILIAPILGRLYTPADYGLLGAYMGVSSIFGVLGNWQFAQAIAVQRMQARADGVLVVSVWASVLSALLAGLVVPPLVLLFGDHSALGKVAHWLWVLPLTTLAVGISGSFAGYANKRRDYRLMAAVMIATVVTSGTVSIGLGFLGANVDGLLGGFIGGQFVTFATYAIWYRRCFKLLGRFTARRIAALAKWQAHLPIYSLPAAVLYSAAMAAPVMSLAYMGQTDLGGNFSRATTLLSLPLTLAGQAIASVFQQRAADDLARTGTCFPLYRRTLLMLVVGGIPALMVMVLLGPWALVTYLGPRWQGAGDLVLVLAPLTFLRMIEGPLWPIYVLFRKNRLDFIATVFQSTGIVLAIGTILWLALPALTVIYAYVAIVSLVCLWQIMQTYYLARSSGAI